MGVMKLTLYAGICTCFVCMDLLIGVTTGKHLENPKCRRTKVKYENTCEECSGLVHNGVCDPGYKCSDVERDNRGFACYYTRVGGWDQYRNEHDITAFKLANQSSSPLPLISAISLYQRNQTDNEVGYPALKVKVNVPYLLYGSGQQNGPGFKPNEMEWVINHMGHSLDIHKIHYRCTSDALEKTQIAKILLLQDNDRVEEFRGRSLQDIQIEEVPQSLRMVFSSVDSIEYRDSYYYQHPITRLYRFINYHPTSYEVEHPKQVVFKCLTGLDVCGEVRAYTIQLSTYSHSAGLYLELNFTATAYLHEAKWFPVIATSILPGGSVYVVFGPSDLTNVSYEIFLIDQDRHQKTKVENFLGSAEKYSCEFIDVQPGTYQAKLLVKYSNGTVSTYTSAAFTIPGETSTTYVPASIPATDFAVPILVIVVSLVIAVSLLLLLCWQRNNKDFFKYFWPLPVPHQECKKKLFLLHMREAEKFVPCITQFLNDKLSSMEVLYDKDWENESAPFDLFKVKVKQCSHLLVLWSPSASDCMSENRTLSSIEINPDSTVQDYFKEAMRFSKDLSAQRDLKIVVLYIPDYAEMKTVSENIGEHQKFDVTCHCKKLCKYLIGDKSEFNAVPENALQRQIEKLLSYNSQGDKDEIIDKHSSPGSNIQEVEEKKINQPCPVHSNIQPPNIPVSPGISHNIDVDPRVCSPNMYDPSHNTHRCLQTSNCQQHQNCRCPLHITQTELAPHLDSLTNNGHLYPDSSTNNGHLYPDSSTNNGHLYPDSSTNNGHLYPDSSTNNGHLYPDSSTNNGHLYPDSSTYNGHLYPDSSTNNGHLYPDSSTYNGHLYLDSSTNNGHLYPDSSTNNGHLYPDSSTYNGHLYLDSSTNNGHLYPDSSTNNGHLYPGSSTNHGHMYPDSSTNNGHLYPGLSTNNGHLYPDSLTNNGHLYPNIPNDQNATTKNNPLLNPPVNINLNEERYDTEDSLTSDQSSMEPLLNRQSSKDEGYESKLSKELQNKFLELNSEDY